MKLRKITLIGMTLLFLIIITYFTIAGTFEDDIQADWQAGSFTNTTHRNTGNITLLHELADNQYNESADVTNGTDMTGNLVLLHLNGDVTDTSGQGQTVVAGATLDNSNSRIGEGSFNIASGQDINISYSDEFDNINDKMTISAWIYPTGNTGTNRFIHGAGGPSAKLASPWYTSFTTGEKLRFFIQTATGSTTVTAGTNIVQNEWQFLTWTYDGTNIEIFINAVSKGTSALSGDMNTMPEGIRIGQANDTAFPSPMKIDEFAIWNRTLSDGEINDMYQRGLIEKGIFVSQVFDATENVQWDNITFKNNTVVKYGTIKFQIRNTDSGGTIGDWVGTDNTSSTYYFGGEGDSISAGENAFNFSGQLKGLQYFQYKVFLETTNITLTPYLEWVNISYHTLSAAPTVTLLAPADNDRTNFVSNSSVNFNVSFTGLPSPDTCSFWINSSGTHQVNQTVTGLATTVTGFSIPMHSAESVKHILWNINCSNSEGNVFAAENRTFHLDNIGPNLVNGIPANNNQTLVKDILDFNRQCTDTFGLFKFHVNITESDGTNVYSNNNITNPFNTTLDIIDTIDTSGFTPGNFTTALECSDPHSGEEIEDYEYSWDVFNDGIEFITEYNNLINIKVKDKDGENLETIKVKKETDKYTVSFEFSNKKTNKEFVFTWTSDKPFIKVPNSKYIGHLMVLSNNIEGNWVDSEIEGFNSSDSYTLTKIDDYTYDVTISTKKSKIKFKSIGPLNVARQNITFEVRQAFGGSVIQSEPSQSSTQSTSSIDFKYTCTDKFLDEAVLWHNQTGSLLQNVSSGTITSGTEDTITINLPDGNFNWTITCNDTLGNELNSTSLEFIIDTSFGIESTTFSPTIVYSNQSMTFNVTINGQQNLRDIWIEHNFTGTLINETNNTLLFSNNSNEFFTIIDSHNFTAHSNNRLRYCINSTTSTVCDSVQTFTLQNRNPDQPTFITINDTTTPLLQPIFNFNLGADEDNDDVQSSILIDDNQDFSSIEYKSLVTGTTHTVTQILIDQRSYYYQINNSDTFGTNESLINIITLQTGEFLEGVNQTVSDLEFNISRLEAKIDNLTTTIDLIFNCFFTDNSACYARFWNFSADDRFITGEES